MKNLLFLSLIVGSTIISSHAQGLYFGAGLGYGFKSGSQYLGVNNTLTTSGGSNTGGSFSTVNGSYGAGFVPSIEIGYLFTKNLGIEINAGYLIGKNYTFQKSFTNINSSFTSQDNNTTENHINAFFLNPAFVIRGTGEGKIIPYAKLGLFLGFGTTFTSSQSGTSVSSAGSNVSTINYFNNQKGSGNISTGVTGALGLDFMISKNIAIFGEMSIKSVSWSPSSYESDYNSTSLNNNNNSTTITTVVDQIPADLPYVTSSSTSNGITTFTKYNNNSTSTTTSSFTGTQSNFVTTTNNKELTYPMPLSAIGFAIGVRYYLFKK